jgi:hypothetical protein
MMHTPLAYRITYAYSIELSMNTRLGVKADKSTKREMEGSIE